MAGLAFELRTSEGVASATVACVLPHESESLSSEAELGFVDFCNLSDLSFVLLTRVWCLRVVCADCRHARSGSPVLLRGGLLQFSQSVVLGSVQSGVLVPGRLAFPSAFTYCGVSLQGYGLGEAKVREARPYEGQGCPLRITERVVSCSVILGSPAIGNLL